MQNSDFKIPAGNADYEVKSSYTFRQDSVVHALLPHMHYRGKDFTYTATYPDGRSEILLKVPAYDFNWQTLYQLGEAARDARRARGSTASPTTTTRPRTTAPTPIPPRTSPSATSPSTR